MKIESFIIDYLKKNKTVDLEEIGTLSIPTTQQFSTESDEVELSDENSIHFEFNKNTQADVGLIQYIVEKTGKLKPLVAADIQSFTVLGKQFLNIGKPFIIPPIGYLLKNQKDRYEFFQGENTSQPIQTLTTQKASSIYNPHQIDFSSPTKNKQTKPITQIIMIGVCLLIPTIVFVYMYLHQQKDSSLPLPNTDSLSIQSSPNNTDTSSLINTSDTVKTNADSFHHVNTSSQILNTDSLSKIRPHVYKKKKADSLLIKDSIK